MIENRIDTYVSLDLETTGLNPKQDRVIEIGAVKVVEGRTTSTYQTYINPGRSLNDKVSELTGITNEMLKGAPEINDVIHELLEFIGDHILVGHQLLFDYAFVKRAAVNNKLAFEKNGIDTLKLARILLPDIESKRLGYLCQYYQIPHSPHRALGDAQATSDLFLRLSDQYYNEEDFKPVTLVYRVKKEAPITKPQKERLYKLVDKHKIVIEYEIDKLTRNEASRITDRILSVYGR